MIHSDPRGFRSYSIWFLRLVLVSMVTLLVQVPGCGDSDQSASDRSAGIAAKNLMGMLGVSTGALDGSERVGDGSLSFTDGVGETIGLENLRLQLSLPVFSLQGTAYSIHYRERERDYPISNAGTGLSWTPLWFGGLHRINVKKLYGHPSDSPFSTVKPGIWLLSEDGGASQVLQRKVPIESSAIRGTELRATDMSLVRQISEAQYSVQSTTGVETTYDHEVALANYLDYALTNQTSFAETEYYKKTLLLPTKIVDAHGNTMRVEYYGKSPFPRMVQKGRTIGSSFVEVARAYFYLSNDPGLTSGAAEPQAASVAALEKNTVLTEIRYAAANSTSLTSVSADWAKTRFEYETISGTGLKNLTRVTVLGKVYSLSYAKPDTILKNSDWFSIPYFQSPYYRQFLSGVTLPNRGGVIRYKYLTIDAPNQESTYNTGTAHTMVVQRKLTTGEGKTYVWHLDPMSEFKFPRAYDLYTHAEDIKVVNVYLPNEDGTYRRDTYGFYIYNKIGLDARAHHAAYYERMNGTWEVSDPNDPDMMILLRSFASGGPYMNYYSPPVNPEADPVFTWMRAYADRFKEVGASELKERTVYGYARFSVGVPVVSDDPKITDTCREEVALPSFVTHQVFKKGLKESKTSIKLHREQNKKSFMLKAFGNGNTHQEFDAFLNAPRERTSLQKSGIGTVHISPRCRAWADDYTACHNAYAPVNPAAEWLTTDDGDPSDPNCFQDYVELGEEDTGETRENAYLYETTTQRDTYYRKNLMGLVSETREKNRVGTLVGLAKMDYDYEQASYPSLSSTPGNLSKEVLGRLTRTQRFNPQDISMPTSVTYYAYYGPGSTELPGALAETAVLVDQSNGLKYRRIRQSYASHSNSIGLPSAPTKTWAMDTGNTLRLMGETGYGAWGQVIWTRDPFGNVSRRFYDELGRLTDAYGPLDTAAPSISLSYDDQSLPRKSIMTARGSQNRVMRMVSFADSQGRTIQQQQEMPEGGATVVDVQYWKNSSKAKKTTMPYASSTWGSYISPMFNNERQEVTFDEWGRVVQSNAIRSNSTIAQTTRQLYGDTDPSLSLFESKTIDPMDRETIQKIIPAENKFMTILPGGRVNTTQALVDSAPFRIVDTQADGLKSTKVLDGLGRIITQTTPEGGTVTVNSYDLTGNALKVTLSNNKFVTLEYDSWGRLNRKQDSMGNTHVYTYDTYPAGSNIINSAFGLGKLTRVDTINSSGALDAFEAYGYDRQGQLVETAIYLAGLGVKKATASYDDHGAVLSTSYQQNAEGTTLFYAYDGAYRPLNLLESNNAGERILVSWQYDALGRLTRQKYLPTNSGALQDFRFTYDAWGRLTKFNDPQNLGNSGFAYEIGYEGTGGLSSVTPRNDGLPSWIKWNSQGNTLAAYTYRYDERDFLSTADYRSYSAGTWTNPLQYDVHAEYDSVGNILSMFQNTQNTNATPVAYAYQAGTRRLDRVTGGITAAFTYDAAGNLKGDNRLGTENTLDYDGFSQLVSIIDSNKQIKRMFFYDATGKRYKTEEWKRNGVSYDLVSRTFTVQAGGITAEYKNTELSQLMIGDIAVKIPAGSTIGSAGYTFFVKDHLGSTRAAIRENGIVSQVTDYLPFGLKMEARSKTFEPLDLTKQFTGYEPEKSISVPYNFAQARFYDPTLGRFMRPDPLGSLNPQVNRYAYTNNLPHLLSDPSGLIPGTSRTGGPGTPDPKEDGDPLREGGALPEVTIVDKLPDRFRNQDPNSIKGSYSLTVTNSYGSASTKGGAFWYGREALQSEPDKPVGPSRGEMMIAPDGALVVNPLCNPALQDPAVHPEDLLTLGIAAAVRSGVAATVATSAIEATTVAKTYGPFKLTPMLSKYTGERVKYFTAEEVAATQVIIKNGNLYNANGELLNARKFIYVMDENGTFYTTRGLAEVVHHSSILSGKPVAAAGEWTIKNGKIIDINAMSGHYRPSDDFFEQAFNLLRNENVFAQ